MKFKSIAAVTLMTVFSAGAMNMATAAEKGKAPAPAAKAEKAEAVKVADIFAKKDQLKGKKVTVKGKVTKYNAGIMGMNWLHINDGSGKQGTNDITVTTNDVAAAGDTVTVTGTVVVNKDFGSGYKYDVIIQEATVSK